MKSVKKENRKVAIRPSSLTTIYFDFLDLLFVISYFGKYLKTMSKLIILLLIFLAPLLTTNAQSLGALIPDFRVNDDISSTIQSSPKIGVDGNGNFIITWNDRRNQNLQVYCQRFAFDGARLGINFRIGHDTAGGGYITVLDNSRFIVAWQGNVSGKNDIYFQRFYQNGTPNGGMFKVNDTNSTGPFASVSDIGADSLGNFVIVWMDYRNGILYPDVFGQRYDSAGNRLGNNFKINDNTNQSSQTGPRIAFNKDGSFIVCWVDNRSGLSIDIFMQRYDRFGFPIGINQRVDDDVTNASQTSCDVSSDGRGYFVVAFGDRRELYNTEHVYYQVYDSLGNKIGVNRKADENIGQTGAWTPQVSMESNGKFVITWSDDRNVNGVPFTQRFNKDGSKIGVNFRIPQFNNTPTYSFQVVSLFSDRIYTAWNDNRNGNFDIFANVKSFINPDSILAVIGSKNQIASRFKLYPAYPNPFNPSSIISYELRVASYVRIVLYDVKGKEIAVLVNGFKYYGLNNYVLNCNEYNLSSGIYFVKLIVSTGYEESIKIILLK